MKNFKFFLVGLIFCSFTPFLFAQEDDSAVLDALELVKSEKEKADSSAFEAVAFSVYALFDIPIAGGEDGYKELVTLGVGAGLGAEVALPFRVPLKNQLGLSVRGFYKGDIIDRTEVVSSINNIGVTGGVFYKLPLGASPFTFVPELSYGAIFRFVDSPNDSSLDDFYASHLVQVTPAFRLSFSGSASFLDIELSPIYSLYIDSDGELLHELGARVGTIFKL